MDKNEVLDKLFGTAAKVLDSAYGVYEEADTAIAGLFGKADEFLNEVEKATRARLDKQEQPKAAKNEPAERELTLQEKVDFVSDYWDALGEIHGWHSWKPVDTQESRAIVDSIYQEAVNGTLR